ncbi:MAG: oligosaccharide flippase family protein [Proteobacteria bacterium]|nr:oligosaccharide flippase family protein [Pseudomonadota bacterium]
MQEIGWTGGMADMMPAPEAKAAPSLASTVAGGMLWVAGSTLIGKSASFLAQLVLGWVLGPEDFALYAIAISVATMLFAVRNGGVRELLIQRGRDYDALAPGCFRIAMVFNIGLAGLLLASAPLLASIYQAPKLPQLLWVIAAYIALYTPASILQAKLYTDMRFNTIGKLNSVSMVLRQLSAVLLALGGLGALSFVLPLVLVAVFESLAFLFALGRWPRGGQATGAVYRMLSKDSRWVMFGALATALVMQGDYMTVGYLCDKTTLGFYFFGFQLSMALESLFVTGLQTVMFSAFASLADQPQRQSAAFLKASGILSYIVAPLCLGLVLVAGPLVHTLWHGKWDAATIVFQLILVGMFMRIQVPLGVALMESRGKWRLRSLLVLCDGLGLVAAAALGAKAGGLTSIAVYVGGYRLISSLLQCMVVSRSAEIPAAALLRRIIPPAATALACAALAYSLWSALCPISGDIARAALTLGSFTGLYALASLTLMRSQTAEASALILERFRRTGGGAKQAGNGG